MRYIKNMTLFLFVMKMCVVLHAGGIQKGVFGISHNYYEEHLHRTKGVQKEIFGISHYNYFEEYLPRTEEIPKGVAGISHYNYFEEYLPTGTRGIYQILDKGYRVKYIGSSCDINKRLAHHLKKGILDKDDWIQAIIFHNHVRQIDVLAYEKFLIRKFCPPLNRHTGAPGRAWRSEQISKLKVFFDRNHDLLQPQGQVMIRNLLAGTVPCEDPKMVRSLLRLMRFFR